MAAAKSRVMRENSVSARSAAESLRPVSNAQETKHLRRVLRGGAESVAVHTVSLASVAPSSVMCKKGYRYPPQHQSTQSIGRALDPDSYRHDSFNCSMPVGHFP